MKLLLRSLPLLCLAVAASSCSNAIQSIGRDPRKLHGKARAEVLRELGEPLHSSRNSKGRVSSDSFHVPGAWRSGHEAMSGNEFLGQYTLGASELILVPAAAVIKARETSVGCDLQVLYKDDPRQTVVWTSAWIRD